MSKLVLIDANSLIHRSYHAIPPLTTSKGELVNAVFGFASTLLKVLSELKPDFLAIAFDVPGKTFRHADFPQYKAQRPTLDKALGNQFERTRQVADAFGAAIFEVPEYEADDLIGTLAKQAVNNKQSAVNEVVIVSGDRDELQLVNDKVKVYLPGRTMGEVTIYDTKKVEERYSLKPGQLIDFKALAGDQSDNIPGVKGVGETTAAKVIAKWRTLENLYKNLDKVEPKFAEKLKIGKESAFLSKKLATIETAAPVKLDLAKCQVGEIDWEKLVRLFEELEFRSLITRLPGVKVKKEEVGETPKITVSTQDEIDKKLAPILAAMSEVGVLVDPVILAKASAEIGKKIKDLEKQIFSEVTLPFNLNSPKQLAEVLYDKLGLPVLKKTKTGRSTDEQTLLDLQTSHSIVPAILEYRELFKLKSTYLDALPKSAGIDGRIHSQFRTDVTATGRLSSQNPNLQNIPIRSDWGTVIRKAFVVPKGFVLLSADYSQIELRVAAHISGDEGLREAFAKGLDVHSATAAKILGKPLAKIIPNDRRLAKTVNFGLLYGMSAHGLAQALKIDYGSAQKFIDEYFAQFPKVLDYIEKTITFAKKAGFVLTLLGRKIPVPQIQADNARIRAAGERMATNYPIQGSSAEIIKKAMIEISKQLSGISKQARMVLQIHDELLFEVPQGEIKKVAKFVKSAMENAVKLSVPVIVDVKYGKNWGKMKPIKNSILRQAQD